MLTMDVSELNLGPGDKIMGVRRRPVGQQSDADGNRSPKSRHGLGKKYHKRDPILVSTHLDLYADSLTLIPSCDSWSSTA